MFFRQNILEKLIKEAYSGTYYLCPVCKKLVGTQANYCKNCGQKVRRE